MFHILMDCRMSILEEYLSGHICSLFKRNCTRDLKYVWFPLTLETFTWSIKCFSKILILTISFHFSVAEIHKSLTFVEK